MKIRSFTISLLAWIVYSMNLTSCSALPASPTATTSPTQTPTPTTTSTETPAPTATLSADKISQMTEEDKLAASPEIDGLTKSSVSTVEANLIIYRDAEGKAQKVYDLTSGKELTLQEGGVIEFDLKSGGTIELLSFESQKDIENYIVNVSGTIWLNGGESEKTRAKNTFFKGYTPEDKALFDKLNDTSEYTSDHASGYTLPEFSGSGEFFAGFYYKTDSGTFWCFKNKTGALEVVFQSN